MKRKDFIRNMLMGFAVSLLPKPLLPSDPLSEFDTPPSVVKKYRDESVYQITYDTGHGNYIYWASGKMLNAMEAENIRMFKYYGEKTSR